MLTRVLEGLYLLVLAAGAGNLGRIASALATPAPADDEVEAGILPEGTPVLVRYGDTEGLVRVSGVTDEGAVVLEGYGE